MKGTALKYRRCFWKGGKMANRNKEIKDVVDLRSLKHKKFLSEWGTWVNGTYNVRKKTIDDNSTLEIGRKTSKI